jgi:hypothetical protein
MDEKIKSQHLLSLIVPCRELLKECEGINPVLKGAFETLLKALDSFRALLRGTEDVKYLISVEKDAGKSPDLQNALAIYEKTIIDSYGVSSKVYSEVKQWEKTDYRRYPRFFHPVYGEPLMEEAAPGGTYTIWDKKDEDFNIANPGMDASYCAGAYRLHVLMQLQHGSRAILLHNTKNPVLIDPRALVEIQARLFSARKIIELRGITKLVQYETAAEIWIDDVSLADELFKKGFVKG